jgi:hypothetical protein
MKVLSSRRATKRKKRNAIGTVIFNAWQSLEYLNHYIRAKNNRFL